MSTISVPALETDVAVISTVAGGGSTTVATASNGRQIASLTKVINDSMKFKGPAIAWVPSLSITDFLQTYSESGIIFTPNPSFLPFTTGATFAAEANKWIVLQGGGANTVDSISILTALPTQSDRIIYTVLGYNTKGDNGGDDFHFDLGGVAPVDDVVTFAGNGGQWVRRWNGVTTVTKAGAIGDGVADDTIAIQRAVDFVIANANFGNVLKFDAGLNFKMDQVTCNSVLPITFIAYGAFFTLATSGAAGFTFRGSPHKWFGGHPRSNDIIDINFKPRFARVENTAGFPQSGEMTFEDVDCRDIFGGIDYFMDKAAAPGGDAFRQKIINCRFRNFLHGQKLWGGSFGVRFDGDTALDSSGNDSRLDNCIITGFETLVYTNGFNTKAVATSFDGGVRAIHLDGAGFWTDSNCYFEFNDFDFEYSNSPTDPVSFQSTFAAQVSGFATGTLGAGNFGAVHKKVGNIGSGAIREQLGGADFKTNTDDVLDLDTTSGNYLNGRISGVQKVLFDSSDLLLGKTTGLTTGDQGLQLNYINGVINSARNTSALVSHTQYFTSSGLAGNIDTQTLTTTYNSTSDYRLKVNFTPFVNHVDDYETRIVEATKKGATIVERFMGLNPGSFAWEMKQDEIISGFLAHEVQLIEPMAVTGEKDGMQDVGTIIDKNKKVISKNVPHESCNQNCTWEKTGTAPKYQSMDPAKLIPIIVAMVMYQQIEIDKLKNTLKI